MKKKALTIIVLGIVLWSLMVLVDYSRAQRFEMPIFCVATEVFQDGGSGHYVGLGYSFDIKGNFMPEDEFPGVTKWTYYLFGIEMETQIRD